MISCETARALIDKAIDGTIGKAEHAELEAHAETCEACRNELKCLEQTEEVIADAFASRTEALQAKNQIMAHISERVGTPTQHTGSVPGYWTWTRTAIAAVVMLAAGLTLGFVLGREGQNQPPASAMLQEAPVRIGRLEGMVLVKHGNSDVWQPVRSGAVVYLGDTFHSMPRAAFVLDLGNNSTIDVSPNSMLALVSYGSETEFSLEQGECTANLQSPHGPFFVRTPHGRIEALGTEFTVTVE